MKLPARAMRRREGAALVGWGVRSAVRFAASSVASADRVVGVVDLRRENGGPPEQRVIWKIWTPGRRGRETARALGLRGDAPPSPGGRKPRRDDSQVSVFDDSRSRRDPEKGHLARLRGRTGYLAGSI